MGLMIGNVFLDQGTRNEGFLSGIEEAGIPHDPEWVECRFPPAVKRRRHSSSHHAGSGHVHDLGRALGWGDAHVAEAFLASHLRSQWQGWSCPGSQALLAVWRSLLGWRSLVLPHPQRVMTGRCRGGEIRSAILSESGRRAAPSPEHL